MKQLLKAPFQFLRWLIHPRHRLLKLSGLFLFTLLALYVTTQLYAYLTLLTDPRGRAFMQWFTGDEAARRELITVQREACPGAPFILPADGFIGLLYSDPRGPYTPANPHQGIDIFSPTDVGVTPVYAAYDGYITREPTWRSTLIQRVPDDPLHPGRQIWLYYTHMAKHGSDGDFIEDAFPPGVREVFVEQGTLLGYTGDYNGNSPRPVGVHLHFSIVQDNGQGAYLNELDIANTLDPSPYLGMNVHYDCAELPVGCSAGCAEASGGS